MLSLRICIDVPTLEEGIRFYEAAFGLTVARRFKGGWAELAGGPCPIDLLPKAEGSKPSLTVTSGRTYKRHWTPLHLDFVVDDIEASVKRAREAGAVLESEIQDTPYGRGASLADPFGNGLCLIQLIGRGYDELLSP